MEAAQRNINSDLVEQALEQLAREGTVVKRKNMNHGTIHVPGTNPSKQTGVMGQA